MHRFFLLGAKICIGMEWFRVHLDKVRHTNHPVLEKGMSDAPLATRPGLTFPSELFGTGRFGKETSASFTTSPVSGGISSSSYSSACRRSLSGDGSLSDSGAEAVGDAAGLL